MAKRITGELPEATLTQRVRSMSTHELMTAARALAKQTDLASDEACTAALDELYRRAPGSATVDAFVAEIYS